MFTQTEKMVSNQIPLHNDRLHVTYSTLASQLPPLVTKPYVYGASNPALRPCVGVPTINVAGADDEFWGVWSA